MKKNVIKTIISAFVLALFTLSCTKESIDDGAGNTTKDDSGSTTKEPENEPSATAANLASSTPKRGSEYNFSYNVNTPIKVEVTKYDEDYTYELKLTGKYFKKEYTVALSKQVEAEVGNGDTISDEKVKDGSEVSDGRLVRKGALLAIAEPTDPIGVAKTTLVADVENLQMEADAYSGVLVEKESEAEFSIMANDNDVILDIDSPHFLTTTQLENDSWVKLSTLNLSDARFRVRPANNSAGGYISGVSVQLAVYDTSLNLLGRVTSNGSNGVRNRGTYSYRFASSNVNTLIPSNGDYLFRLEEREFSTDTANKVYKKGIFQKIAVTKTVVVEQPVLDDAPRSLN